MNHFQLTKHFTYFFIFLLALTGCSHRQPIYNVEHHAIPSAARHLSAQQIGEQIKLTVGKRGWQCNSTSPNSLMCCIDKRNHQAQVRVDYNQDCFSIHKVGTYHLNEKNGAVSKKYNQWIKNMEKDIIKALSQLKCAR